MIFDRMPRPFHVERIVFSTNCAGNTYIYMQKKLGPLFKITDKLTQKESDLKSTKFLQIDIRQELHDTGFGDVFLNMTKKVDTIKQTNKQKD